MGTVEDQGAGSLKVVTPHASNPLPDGPCRALYVGVGGTVVVKAVNDKDYVTVTAAAGLLPVRAIAVKDTGTATSIVALY